MATRVGSWSGGYIRRSKSGRKVYVIERWQKGRRIHVSTGCTTLDAAKKEFARFELDPVRYEPGGMAVDGVYLDADLILAYRAHQLASGITREWTDEVVRCLDDWMDALHGRDLRALRLHLDLRPALDRWEKRRPHRIKAIKGLFRWLRQEKGLVDRNQDATLDLRVPQARPEKQRRRKVVPAEDVAAVLRHLKPSTRDILHLLTATAWHISEVRKFWEAGEIVQPLNAEGVLAVLITRHKSGDLTKTPLLYPEHLAAAERVRKFKRFPKRMTISRHMRKAVVDAEVPKFNMGQMRHTVLTWGVEAGASLQAAAEFAHHRSSRTTERHYVDLAIPRAPIPIRRLAEPKG